MSHYLIMVISGTSETCDLIMQEMGCCKCWAYAKNEGRNIDAAFRERAYIYEHIAVSMQCVPD